MNQLSVFKNNTNELYIYKDKEGKKEKYYLY